MLRKETRKATAILELLKRYPRSMSRVDLKLQASKVEWSSGVPKCTQSRYLLLNAELGSKILQ